MKITRLFFIIFLLTLFIPFALADTELSVFQKVYEPEMIQIAKPTVVSVTLPDEMEYGNRTIQENTHGALTINIPAELRRKLGLDKGMDLKVFGNKKSKIIRYELVEE